MQSIVKRVKWRTAFIALVVIVVSIFSVELLVAQAEKSSTSIATKSNISVVTTSVAQTQDSSQVSLVSGKYVNQSPKPGDRAAAQKIAQTAETTAQSAAQAARAAARAIIDKALATEAAIEAQTNEHPQAEAAATVHALQVLVRTAYHNSRG